MLKGLLSGLTSRTAFLTVMLVSNAFVWYYCADNILVSLPAATSDNYVAIALIWGTNFAALIGSALIGARLTDRLTDRTQFLSFWMLGGMVLPFASFWVDPNNFLSVTLLGVAFSSSLGIGLPACMGYFTSQTSIETRGRLGGMIMLVTGLSVVFLSSLASDTTVTQATVLAGWRSFGLCSFLLLRPAQCEKLVEKKPISYANILKQRIFLSYFIPWIMFSLVNYLSKPVLSDIFAFEPEFLATTLAFENGLIGLSAFLGGWLVDTMGRKRMAIVGFVTLGLGYAVLGSSPSNVWAVYFHTAVDGIAWGILLVVFVTTLWGDLSYNKPSDRLYAVGVLPFFISRFLPMVIPAQALSGIGSAVFSFVAFFLFLAVLPLVYAPETLPEKIVRERELKTYLDKAKEIVARAQRSEESWDEDKDLVKFEVPQECDEEAEELAQKYY